MIILLDLPYRYDKPTPAEKTEADTKWRESWNPSEPIENMFLNLEELFVRAAITGLLYIQQQLLDKALDNVKRMGLYINAVMDWNAFADQVKI